MLRFVLTLLIIYGVLPPIVEAQTSWLDAPRTTSVRPAAKRFRAMWWNVENLYDTLHDAGFDDREFLPTAERRWDTYRYWRKQGDVAKIIVAAGGLQPVDLVGLCEIENDSVISHLLRRTRLARLGYEAIVTQSNDLRGIDLALLYQPENFAPFAHGQHEVPRDSLRDRPTRPILHVAGRTMTADTLDILLAHFPSRRGGITATEPYRLRAAQLAVQLIDSLAQCRQNLHILMMGDLNDEPTDRSVQQVLGQRLHSLSAQARPTPRKGNDDIEGTYYFQHRWSRIDHILVNAPLLRTDHRLHTAPSHCHIFAFPLLLETNHLQGQQPRRTYRGTHYHGGVSDHLPLVVDFWY